MSQREGKKIVKVVLTVVMLAIGVICIFPFIFMIYSSFKPTGEVLSKPFEIISKNATVQNYIDVFHHRLYSMAGFYKNTLFMTGMALLIKSVVVTLTAYGFSKIKFPGRDAIFFVLLGALMIPSDVLLIPRYIVFNSLHLIDSSWVMILPAAVDVYFVFQVRQSFLLIPASISEAARIDGCGHFKIYLKIIVPLAKASIATMLLFSFVWLWNDYTSPYLYINDYKKQMLSVGIKMIAQDTNSINMGVQMAAATLVLLPLIVVFFITQRYFVEGITAGAVKG